MERSPLKFLALCLCASAAVSAAGVQKFSGTITDGMCASADHASMRMGPTDAECAVACADAHGATYVLYDGKNAYALSDQTAAEAFAAEKVTVLGTRDAKTRMIKVESILDDAPPK